METVNEGRQRIKMVKHKTLQPRLLLVWVVPPMCLRGRVDLLVQSEDDELIWDVYTLLFCWCGKTPRTTATYGRKSLFLIYCFLGIRSHHDGEAWQQVAVRCQEQEAETSHPQPQTQSRE